MGLDGGVADVEGEDVVEVGIAVEDARSAALSISMTSLLDTLEDPNIQGES